MCQFILIYLILLHENDNLEIAHEVMQCMVRNFAEIGMLKEDVSVIDLFFLFVLMIDLFCAHD